ncbi:gliding motility-associated C-terminal domain-containing protein [Ekhidna sp. To15]|uniref:T9SS type B sorting domain-containing protein n=1 Tax=Ekhidna sp. To15 TaxID=3395267 RepID=UPI003F528DF0
MKKFLITVCLFLTIGVTNAFHIVGGEIEFIYLSDGRYRINLIQYFDEAQNQNPGADQFITVYIFRNGDDQLMSTHTLPLSGIENVEYTNIECARDELQTSRVFYSADIELSPEQYDSEGGYYIQWERCCRNTAINNIVNPQGTGMNYVLEIPPLMKNGEIFVNSSPVLFKPLSDYACINQLYYTEFTGVDPDGDSLVYSLVTPLNSSSAVALPIPQPKPHFGVTFLNGFSVSNMVGGTQPLRISSGGLLTVNPDQTGLFVFAVKVDEYRNGEKIGEVRRDFQMLVVDGCDPPDPPSVDIEIPGNPTFNPETDILTYVASDVEKCFDFIVSNVTIGETISLRAEGVNFNEELNEIFTLNQIPVGGGESQLQIEVCIPDCPPIRDAPFILDLIASDDACPLPQLDTLRLTIEVEPPSNSPPTGSTSTASVTRPEDSPIYSQVISGIDVDGDELELTLFVEDVEDPTTVGFDLIDIDASSGSIQATLTWNTDCETYDFTQIQNFNVGVIVNDGDICDLPGDTVFIEATVILPTNNDPQISVSNTFPSQVDLGTNLTIEVNASDVDGDDVTLSFIGGNFDPELYGASFTTVSGNSSVSSDFTWDLTCDANRFIDGQQFELLFIADDDDKCKVKNFDTLRHFIQVNYPENSSPEFDPIERNQSLRVNEYAEIEIGAFDSDSGDEITIQFAQGVRQPASGTLELLPVSGQSRATALLKWQPECSLLRFGETSTLQDIILQVSDNACPISKIDTLKLTVEIFDDSERQQAFAPPNIFTPNGDGRNDVFSLSGNPNVDQNLPPDNCDNTFEYIAITNRAGATVFRSNSRDFIWTGGQFPSGIYYYVIKYTNSEFKGYIHLMK